MYSSKQSLIRRFTAALLVAVLLLPSLPVMAAAEDSGCTHVHGGTCGYMDAAPCGYVHTHDENCGYSAGSACTDTHIHGGACGYIEAAPCGHMHGDGCGGTVAATAAVTITITPDAPLYLTEGVACTEGDLLAGVTAVDENGNPVAVTVRDVGGLELGNPQRPQGPVFPAVPYTITYAAQAAGGEATATRECYVAAGIKAADGSVSAFDNLQSSILLAPPGGTSTITITADITFTGTIYVPADRNITIQSDSTPRTLLRDAGLTNDALFQVAPGGELTLTGITLDGNGDNATAAAPIVINDGGTLTVGAGAVLCNNKSSGDGGGVVITNGGTVNIYGGKISGNTASNGGGIYIDGGSATVTGYIPPGSGGKAGNEISGNTAQPGDGGGVYIAGGSAIINGCSLTGNAGGGIYVASGATATINYNRIFNNRDATGIDLESYGTTECDFNWWGSNNPDMSSFIGAFLYNYLVFEVTNLTPLASTGTVRFQYTLASNTGEYCDSFLLPYFAADVSTDLTSGVITSFDARYDNNFDITLNTAGPVTYSFVVDEWTITLDGTITENTVYRRAAANSTAPISTIPATATATWLERDPAATLAAGAKSRGESFARTRDTGIYGVRGNAWGGLTGLRYEHDTAAGGAVQVRLYIRNPEALTEDTKVSGYTGGTEVERVKAHFEKWFNNKLRVVYFDHSGAWGQPVEVAASVDLTGMDTAKLHLYSYDRATNSYRRILNTAHWADANGYLHFTTEHAGDIIISDGPLVRR